jgi:hypothetical protein
VRSYIKPNGTIGFLPENISRVNPHIAFKALGPTATTLFVTADIHATVNNKNLSTPQKWLKGGIIVTGAAISTGAGVLAGAIGSTVTGPGGIAIGIGVSGIASGVVAGLQNSIYDKLGLN